MNKYREEFEKETNCPWINSQGEPDIDYVEYLESKLEQAEKEKKELVDMIIDHYESSKKDMGESYKVSMPKALYDYTKTLNK